MNDNTENAKQEILQIISKSSLPEDLPHAKNTVEWVLKLNPKASQAMQIAALAHDIDRADENRKRVLDINYPDKQLTLLIQDSFSEAISS